MKDIEKQMKELEKQLEKMGERLEFYSKFGENIAKKYSKAYGGKVWVFSDDDADTNAEGCGTEKTVKPKSGIEKMLPYLDEDSLHELVESFINGETEIEMKNVLPYLEGEEISLLINKLCQCDGEEFNGLTVDDILPYAEDEDVDEIFMKGVKAGKIDKRLFCYVSDDCWHELAEDYCRNEHSELNIDEVLPYLDEDDINAIFKTYLKRHKKNI